MLQGEAVRGDDGVGWIVAGHEGGKRWKGQRVLTGILVLKVVLGWEGKWAREWLGLGVGLFGLYLDFKGGRIGFANLKHKDQKCKTDF